MLPDQIPVFLNGQLHDRPAGETLRSLVAAVDADLTSAWQRGEVRATDGRGIAVDADTPLVAGAIFRVFRSARQGGSADA